MSACGGARAALVVPAVRTALAAADAVLAAASFMLAFVLREGEPVFAAGGGLRGAARSSRMARCSSSSSRFVCSALLLRPLPAARRVLARRGRVRVLKAVLVGSLLVIAAAFLYRGVFEFRAFS